MDSKATNFQHVEFIGGYTLFFEAGTTEVDSVIVEAGFSPSGYFWERIAQYLYESDRIEGPFAWDSSLNFFSVNGSLESTEALKAELGKLVGDAAALREVMSAAEADDFELEY
ncbi:hypothetical protein ACXZ66_13260 [Corynebacterium sp. S7]